MIDRELSKLEKDLYTQIGKKISQKRKSSRKKIQGISNKLNINVEYIENIEKGQLEKIPTHIPINGFIRSYAKLIGSDIAPELSQLNKYGLTENNELGNRKKTKKNEKSFFWYFVIFLVITFLCLYFFTTNNNRKKLNEINTPYGINYYIINKKT